MIWAGRFKKILEVICRLSRLTFKITLSSGNKLLIGVIGILVVIAFIATSGDRDPLGPPLWHPLIAFDGPPCSLVGCYGWRSSA
jgi:hypothetical protein